MYKCSNNHSPDYISDIIPLVAEVSNYPLRNRDNISNIYKSLETARRSCIPSFVTHWNSLRANIREADATHLFVKHLRRSFMQCECPF